MSRKRKSAKFSKNSGGRTVISDLATRKSSFLTKYVTNCYLKTLENCVTIGAEVGLLNILEIITGYQIEPKKGDDK